MSANLWQDRLLAFLHDPPDKPADIKGHIARACRYAEAALDQTITQEMLKTRADSHASAVERFPAPQASHHKVSPVEKCLEIRHPLSGNSRKLTGCEVDETAVDSAIREIVERAGDEPRKRFLALWRLLPERLAKLQSWLALAPADTRIPDHTIWQHLDITTGLAATDEGARGAALLSFALGPVQSFIATARSVRDLWTGSMIISYLVFRGMGPILEQFGPTAFVYPSLRGIPLLDLWLREPEQLGSGFEELNPDEDMRGPCLPNRFLAVVPWGADGTLARNLAKACRERAKQAWKKLAEDVRSQLARKFEELPYAPEWDRRWNDQIRGFFDFRTSVLQIGGPREEVDGRLAQLLDGKESFDEAFEKAASVRGLAHAIRAAGHAPGYDQEQAGRWQYQVELSARMMQSQRSIRPIPTYEGGNPAPSKCSLMGTYEQLGPDTLDQSRLFWGGDPERKVEGAVQRVRLSGVRLRQAERLCAVAVVKRFSGRAYFASRLGLEAKGELYFEDVSSVAAAEWFKNHPELHEYAKKQQSSSWLHWDRPNQEEDDSEKPVPDEIWQKLRAARSKERPPAYYAILMMDGDEMGGWLRGERSPPVRCVMHPDTVKYFEDLGETTRAGLDAPRPVGPALHAAISEALANFALRFVPQIVAKHSGLLIYAGGDDVLALLPTSTVLECARELRETFRQDWKLDEVGRERLLMGDAATVSAGIAVVHVKEDLRFALQAARDAEKQAKSAGRNALQIKVCRRSGEHSSVLCPWEEMDPVGRWVEAFRGGASDRWAYHLAAELPTLCGLPRQAMLAEIRRQLKRAKDKTQTLLAKNVPDVFERYCRADYPLSNKSRKRRFKDDAEALTNFVKLCQTASFLARGRDR